jgi:hypothetical protein
MFIGPPTERTLWENTIIEANNIMRIASAHLDRAKLEGDSIRSGIEYDAVLKVSAILRAAERRKLILRQRPRSIDRRHNLSNMVVLAALRYSPTIQEITSFQNGASTIAHKPQLLTVA